MMEHQSMLDKIKQKLEGFKIRDREGPDLVQRKQNLRLVLIIGLSCVGLALACGLFSDQGGPVALPQGKAEHPVTTHTDKIATPLSGIKEGDLWVSRVEGVVKDYQGKIDDLKKAAELQGKQIEILTQEVAKQAGNDRSAAPVRTEETVKQTAKESGSTGPQKFPVQESDNGYGTIQQPADNLLTDQSQPLNSSFRARTKKKRKLLHLTGGMNNTNAHKGADSYLPAGTYFKIMTSMGVVVTTGTNSSTDPQPILLRLVDNGNLPKGLKGIVKDAVVIGSCYGQASSERAICRLRTLSWRDPQNRVVEKPISGWISGEDGMAGIRAQIVDRSSEIAREAFGAGLLSAASNFLKFEATSSTFPATPFGQTRAMTGKDALVGAGAAGVGSALDKLASFSIARAEAMSPVAVIASGRVLDAVLMDGVDLLPETIEPLQRVSTQARRNQQAQATSTEESFEADQQQGDVQ